MDLDTLGGDQLDVGDVTRDQRLSALDAAVILDHVVGLVDELPYSPTTASMQAMIAISGGDGAWFYVWVDPSYR